jgi:hypothetical protein
MHIFGVTRVRLEELEMLKHRMIGNAELAVDAGLQCRVCTPWNGRPRSSGHAEEIEVPPGAAELSAAGNLQPDLFLLFDDVLDLAVFDLLELS